MNSNLMNPLRLLLATLVAVATLLVCPAAGADGQADPWIEKVSAPHVIAANRTIKVSRQQAAELTAHIDEAVRVHRGKLSTKQARVVLSTIALHESDLQPSVISCAVTGDGGKAVGAYQHHLTGARRDKVCKGGLRAQTYFALYHVNSLLDDTGDFSVVYSKYAGLNNHKAIRELVALSQELSAE